MPALSGLASHFAQRHGQTYHAGIFSGGMAEGLIWAPRQDGTLLRPKEYIAPSWSWASVIGSIQMKGPVKPEHESLGISPVLKDFAFNLIPHGQDPYGRFKDDNVQLTGWLKNAKMSREMDDDELYMLLHADEKWIARFAVDFTDTAPAKGEIQDVEILYVLSGDPAMLVLQTTGDGSQYTRVGLATVDLKWFESKSGEEKRITII